MSRRHLEWVTKLLTGNSGQLAAVRVAWWSISGTGGHCICGGVVAAVNVHRSGWATVPCSASDKGNAEAMVRVTCRRGDMVPWLGMCQFLRKQPDSTRGVHRPTRLRSDGNGAGSAQLLLSVSPAYLYILSARSIYVVYAQSPYTGQVGPMPTPIVIWAHDPHPNVCPCVSESVHPAQHIYRPPSIVRLGSTHRRYRSTRCCSHSTRHRCPCSSTTSCRCSSIHSAETGMADMLVNFLAPATATELRISDLFHWRPWRIMVSRPVTTKRTRAR
jgi:hypothetical protein